MSKGTTQSIGMLEFVAAKSLHEKGKKKQSSPMKKSSILKTRKEKENEPPSKVLESVPSKKPIQFNTFTEEAAQ